MRELIVSFLIFYLLTLVWAAIVPISIFVAGSFALYAVWKILYYLFNKEKVLHERSIKKELQKRIIENQEIINKKQDEAREKQINENRIQQEKFRLELIEIEKIRAKEALN